MSDSYDLHALNDSWEALAYGQHNDAIARALALARRPGTLLPPRLTVRALSMEELTSR